MPALSVTPGRFSSCSSNRPHPSPHTPAPPPTPYQTIPLGGGAGNARRLTIYDHDVADGFNGMRAAGELQHFGEDDDAENSPTTR